MKKTLLGLSIITAILLTGCGETKETFHNNGALKTVVSYNSDKKLDGDYKSYYKNGNKNEESNYSDGKKDGLSTFWQKDGKLISSCIYKNGLKLKDCKKYSNGLIESESNYDDKEKLHGKVVKYHKGHKKMEATYKNGKIEGMMTRYGPGEEEEDESEIIETISFKNDLRDGKSTYYLKNDVIGYEVNFKEGKLVDGQVSKISNVNLKINVENNSEFTNYLRNARIIGPYDNVIGLKY